jgi:hypothetical protein
MQTELQAELILCPNCKEEVPKTLYCLNCGYPLYKMDQVQSEPDETEDVTIEVVPEPIEAVPIEETVSESETIPEAESFPEEPVEEGPEKVEADTAPEPVVDIEPEAVVETIESEVMEEEVEIDAAQEPVIDIKPEEPVETIEPKVTEEVVVDVETELEPPSEIVEEDSTPMEEVTELVEEIVETVEEIAVGENVEVVEAEEPEVIEVPEGVEEAVWDEVVVEEAVPEEVAEPALAFEPDPVIREVMENLAKNISLKIRLVSLLMDGDVKEETFNRLFEGYAARGERLINSRNETLERIRFDLDNMEGALDEAKLGLEELEIRRSIGDASEDEYRAKAPAFEWDISQHNDEVTRKKGEIAYLDNLAYVMSGEDMDELKEMAETCHEAVDGIAGSEMIGSEMAARIKVTLEEAIDCLKGSA